MVQELGPDGWRALPIVADVMRYAQRRYEPVARSWGRPPEEAATAAFFAMRTPSVARADDPWAVVTHAVELAMAAEAQGERGLISPEKARRPELRPSFAPVRASEYEFLLDTAGIPEPGPGETVDEVVQVAAALLAVAGWPAQRTTPVVEYIVARLSDLGSQQSALDLLRRDEVARTRFGLDQPSWLTLLRLLIGSPAQVGVLGRALLGERLAELLADELLLAAARVTVPGGRGAEACG
ncbi:MAG TPA: hypothetical protein VGC05_04680 [Mycobacterium sp.]